jgi:hypothetical protein
MTKIRSRELRRDADAVVGDREDPLALAAPPVTCTRGGSSPAELDRVGDQVLEELPELAGVAADGGELVVGDRRAALLDGRAERDQHPVQHLAGVDQAELPPRVPTRE